MLTIAKFGGSSLSDSTGFARVRRILQDDPARRGVVVSAPGRREENDPKVTDLLYKCWEASPWQPVYEAIRTRFSLIADGCGLPGLLGQEMAVLEQEISRGVTKDYLASRGEYFSAKLLAAYLGWEFIDASAWLRFSAPGKVDIPRSYGALQRLAKRPFVTPGFYGALPDGSICTFPRGGSDITGALAAAALDADLYENWTDVPGILEADPRLIPQARPVPFLTYGELADISGMGAQVLHEGAVAPVRQAQIPMVIRSSFAAHLPGTQILPDSTGLVRENRLLCLCLVRDRMLLTLSGQLSLTEVLHRMNIPADFTAELLGKQTACIPAVWGEPLLEELSPCMGQLEIRDSLALLGVVFAREAEHGPCGAALLETLRQEGIAVEAILRPTSGSVLVLAVPDALAEKAHLALWRRA